MTKVKVCRRSRMCWKSAPALMVCEPCVTENVSATLLFSSQMVLGATLPKPVTPVIPMAGTPGGERIVGQAGNPKIFRDVEIRAADLIESGVVRVFRGSASYGPVGVTRFTVKGEGAEQAQDEQGRSSEQDFP